MFMAVCGAVLAGCGGAPEDLPPLGSVEGVVTLDGNPLAGASVLFTPVDAGALSSARTDEKGRYELYYGTAAKGATIGKHQVQISRYGEGDDTTDAVPLKYNAQTTLTAEVQSGKNTINFDLNSQ